MCILDNGTKFTLKILTGCEEDDTTENTTTGPQMIRFGASDFNYQYSIYRVKKILSMYERWLVFPCRTIYPIITWIPYRRTRDHPAKILPSLLRRNQTK